MEVVLSPGRFGDDGTGAPFQNEEIREWSHVDRLTGMLERARVETGRWKTLNHGAAKSYGKVIDSRERNSADGSVVQRARRQVEVFQSEGPGRSVQVVRASQWSSSRVTDSSTTTTTSPHGLTSLVQKKNDVATIDDPSSLSRLNELSSSSFPRRNETISERLSTLLGSFANHASSSTVPLRRIDSKYSSRTPISLRVTRRSNSNEDLAARSIKLFGHQEDDCNRDTIDESRLRRAIDDSSTIASDVDRRKIREIVVDRDDSTNRDDASRYVDDREKIGAADVSIAIDEPRPLTCKSAIQLLPSSKANTTVVNLINESENGSNIGNNIVSWGLTTSVVDDEGVADESEETTTTATTRTTSPRRESRLEESSIPVNPGRSVKRVGFCKTEIHFAADSGKVNIVETDGKPPPTNKFRRRRRNVLTGGSSIGKNPTIDKPTNVTTDDVSEQRRGEDARTKTDPNLHRGHTTTVNLGSDISLGNELTDRGFPAGRRYSTAEIRPDYPDSLRSPNRGIILRLDDKIYDRLESYSSEMIMDSVVTDVPRFPMGIDVDRQTALKSARLVMNLTRVADVGSSSKIIVDDNDDVLGKRSTNHDFTNNDDDDDDEEVSIDRRFSIHEIDQRSPTKVDDPSDNYLDWQADDEVRCIMLGSSSLKKYIGQDFRCRKLFSNTTNAKQIENINENSCAPQIENRGPNDTIVESLVNEKTCSTNLSSKNVDVADDAITKDVSDVLCTDADNNRVFFKIVKSHEPTIARVETVNLRKKMRPVNKNVAIAKTEKRSNGRSTTPTKKLQSKREHIYVNVFTGSKNTPIYENYKPEDSIPTADSKKIVTTIVDEAFVNEKNCRAADGKLSQGSLQSSAVSKSEKIDDTDNSDGIKILSAVAISNDAKLVKSEETRRRVDDESQRGGNKKIRDRTKESKTSGVARSAQSVATSRARSFKHPDGNYNARSSVSSSEKIVRTKNDDKIVNGDKSGMSKPIGIAKSAKSGTDKSDAVTKQKPVEVVYQTAVYNMRNERLKKPQRTKESRGPRYLNELICGVKMKKPSDAKNSKSSSASQQTANKSTLQPIKHWK